MRVDLLWELADQWDDRVRDKRARSPLERFYWKQAWTELTERLGEREMPTWKK